MITLVGIDPGPKLSAFVAMSGRELTSFGHVENDSLLQHLDFMGLQSDKMTTLVVEMVSSYGMPVGAEVFDTCVWIGRFIQSWGRRHSKVFRATVRAHLCHSSKATDANIRAALLEKYGGKMSAIGNAKKKGPLHGVTGDVWSALAVAITYRERLEEEGTGRLLR